MGLLVRVAGAHTVHVFLCGCMKARFLKHYPEARECTVVSNAKYVAPISEGELRPVGGKLVVGHLSNLGFEKGLEEVVAVARSLLARGHNIELQLAGPAGSAAAQEFIEAAQAELGTALVCHGLVTGEAKEEFYRGLDYFLFPTRYENEAQPNVVFEALSHGVPVVATKRGCLDGDLGRGGLLVADVRRYVPEAIAYLEEGLASPVLSMERKRAALREITGQALAAQAGYQELMKSIVRSART
jgi:glycosyltransferase involved in cell wall biosynthesis